MSKTCRGCGRELVGRKQKVFCSSACQQSHRRRVLLNAWLESGVCGRTSYQGNFVRDHLLEQQASRCAICGITAEWNGSTLALIIDHINGDATDNRRENLRLLCPNCDSQLPTYKARNRGSGRYYRRQRYADGQSY
ncbi:HNH endonuclease signature motif containing protein [Mycobacterium sp. 852014-52144_SCH5372336]|uniref:HNH endonuclease signature motif containing protein n=1 Tax=Mycobacterium sp. 852014-52144_SCH5372336 TaxID=1834115 RepID=UPI0009EE3ABF|nr:HNH endonuclease signature motif containing protein [Mycobacterium sp. 852014-52144_SCH5372336]